MSWILSRWSDKSIYPTLPESVSKYTHAPCMRTVHMFIPQTEMRQIRIPPLLNHCKGLNGEVFTYGHILIDLLGGPWGKNLFYGPCCPPPLLSDQDPETNQHAAGVRTVWAQFTEPLYKVGPQRWGNTTGPTLVDIVLIKLIKLHTTNWPTENPGLLGVWGSLRQLSS